MRTGELIKISNDLIRIADNLINNINQTIKKIKYIIHKNGDIINNISIIIAMLITHLETSAGVDLQRDLSW